ncbi:protoglobin domain-containing protein [Chengkuizengella axinellae]|uniref:Globin-sensor domain-containing protein n=1 Tax=Chengkuizengella axinellae TaxID=3064388 RepID=A0ABT9IYT2_9BACL|nr:hypothetical protein [Chengkuizengella sp. 2205SS18-9]MDP5274473.1 hypothetical protein [Chengkuizengella sp. 2205SS18-9]
MTMNHSFTVESHKIKELIDVFYSHLLQDQYYTKMFKDRNVDIDVLKARQRTFIRNLLSNENETSHEEHQQVKSRHSFGTTPENAKTWLNLMNKSMIEVELEEVIRKHLINKMSDLMTTIINKKE